MFMDLREMVELARDAIRAHGGIQLLTNMGARMFMCLTLINFGL
jgi:hypothetical protein